MNNLHKRKVLVVKNGRSYKVTYQIYYEIYKYEVVKKYKASIGWGIFKNTYQGENLDRIVMHLILLEENK